MTEYTSTKVRIILIQHLANLNRHNSKVLELKNQIKLLEKKLKNEQCLIEVSSLEISRLKKVILSC